MKRVAGLICRDVAELPGDTAPDDPEAMIVTRDELSIICERHLTDALEDSHHAELVEALTPSGDTKYAYLGEFKMPLVGVDECGDEYTENVTVSWDVIKEIMAAIRVRAKIGGDA